MTTTSDWAVESVKYMIDHDGRSNVIFETHWRCIVTDQATGINANASGKQSIQISDLSDFCPYDNVTAEDAVTWTKAAMGETAVAAIEANATARLTKYLQTNIASGTPWQVEVSEPEPEAPPAE